MAEGEERVAVTAPSGPRAVRAAADLKLAEASALLLAATHAATRAPNHDATVLAIPLDGAAVQLRQQHPTLPVIGLTEAALLTACPRSDRLGLLTLGRAMLPLHRQRFAGAVRLCRCAAGALCDAGARRCGLRRQAGTAFAGLPRLLALRAERSR